MKELRPMSVKNMPFERALALPPSLELDMFVFSNILEGPEELTELQNQGRLPAFSRKFADCQMLLVKAAVEVGPMQVTMDPNLFMEAKEKGFIVRKTPCVVWRLDAPGATGYGRNFEEALCKLLIKAKYDPN